MDGFDEHVKEVSLQIQSKVFYEEANLSLLVSLCKDQKLGANK
jgi:hypothetical protein